MLNSILHWEQYRQSKQFLGYSKCYVNEYVSVNEYLNGYIKRRLLYIHMHSTWGTCLPFR